MLVTHIVFVSIYVNLLEIYTFPKQPCFASIFSYTTLHQSAQRCPIFIVVILGLFSFDDNSFFNDYFLNRNLISQYHFENDSIHNTIHKNFKLCGCHKFILFSQNFREIYDFTIVARWICSDTYLK